ncbi:hypothetical protein ACXGQW_06000 [Wenyingzhuangia sp. IMCC45533]
MKRKVILLMIFYCPILFSQNTGDILFTGFNADGDKDFSIVAMVTLNPNTTIYFTDNEPNAAGNGNMGSEGVLKWVTGSNTINAGDIIVFTDVDNDSNSSFGSSVGLLTTVDAGFNISASGDVIYATYGDPTTNSVTKWICGLQNSNTSLEPNFGQTSLSLSENYIVIDETASKDGGTYNGVRENKTGAEFVALLLDENQWFTSTTDGESLLPLSQTPFSFSTLSQSVVLSKSKIQFKIINGEMVPDEGKVIYVSDILGRKRENKNLGRGIYFFQVLLNDKINVVKVSI